MVATAVAVLYALFLVWLGYVLGRRHERRRESGYCLSVRVETTGERDDDDDEEDDDAVKEEDQADVQGSRRKLSDGNYYYDGADYKIEFGRYKGSKLRDLPASYLGWLRSGGVLNNKRLFHWELLYVNYMTMLKQVSVYGRYAEREDPFSIPEVRLKALREQMGSY